MKGPAPQIKALRRRKLIYKSAQDAIKAYIVDHSLKPGDKLPPEADLAEQLRVGRNSVREAVKSLQTLGILRARRGTGLFVSAFSFDPLLDHLGYGILVDLKDLEDVLEVRALIECGLAPRVLAAVTRGQLRKLRAVVGRMRALAEAEGDYSAEADRAFHELLYVNISNRVVAKVLGVFWEVFDRATKRAGLPSPPSALENYHSHAEILTALEQGDGDLLRETMVRHYDGIQGRIRRARKHLPTNGDAEDPPPKRNGAHTVDHKGP